MFWNDKEKAKDVKNFLLKSLEVVYKENNPKSIYFITLYDIFKNYLENLIEEDIGFEISNKF